MLASYAACSALAFSTSLPSSSFNWSLICSLAEVSCPSTFLCWTRSSSAYFFAPPKVTFALLYPLSALAKRKRDSLYFFSASARDLSEVARFVYASWDFERAWSTNSSTTKDVCIACNKRKENTLTFKKKCTYELKARLWCKSLTLARSLFNERNTSCFLMSFSSCLSRERSKACSMHLETSPNLPFWASLRVASDVRASSCLAQKRGPRKGP